MLRLYCNCCNSPANNTQLEAEKERVGDIDIRQWKTEWQRGKDRLYHLHTLHTHAWAGDHFCCIAPDTCNGFSHETEETDIKKEGEKQSEWEWMPTAENLSLLCSSCSVEFLTAPGRSSDKFQPEMDPSLPECWSHECPAYEADEGGNGLRETRCLTQWDSWTSSRGGERARALGLIPSGCPRPHARGYRSRIGTTSPNQRLQSRSRPSCLGH